MRVGLHNGNGAKCDKCGVILDSTSVFKIKVLQLHTNTEKASTGHYKTLYKYDLCESCRCKLNEFIKGE